jgi:hypothetical protein
MLPAPPPTIQQLPGASATRRKRKPAVRKRDVERACAGVQDAGLTITGVQFSPDGGFTVLTGEQPAPASSPLDEWMAKRARNA